MTKQHLPAPSPDDIRETAAIVAGLRSGDPTEFRTQMAKASADPGRFLGAALVLLLGFVRGQDPDTGDGGLQQASDAAIAAVAKANPEEDQ